MIIYARVSYVTLHTLLSLHYTLHTLLLLHYALLTLLHFILQEVQDMDHFSSDSLEVCVCLCVCVFFVCVCMCEGESAFGVMMRHSHA